MPLPNDDRDELRRCRDCGAWKPLDEFHTSPRRPSGRGSYCQPCYNVRSKASYAKRVRERHGREVRQPRDVPAGHRFCPDCQIIKPLEDFPHNRSARSGYGRYCKPCHNVKGRENKEKNFGSTREYHLRRRYGIGQKEFDVLLAAQDGVCAICGVEQPEHVDHDHVSGYIRGILCFNCNGGLGHFRDDMTRMTKAITYLTATSRQREIQPGVHLVLSPRQGMHPVLTHRGGRTR